MFIIRLLLPKVSSTNCNTMKFAIWILFIALLIAFASGAIIPEEQYLPPIGEDEQLAVEQPLEESAALAEDGYRYKTVRKLRHRRDVSELFAQGTLADDGYHYHAPQPSAEPLTKVAQEYLPPAVEEATENKEVSEAPKVSNEYLPPPSAEEIVEMKEITEAPQISREYLPPTEAAATLDVPKFAASEELPSPSADDDAVIIEGPEESSVLADDGYHYRRIRYRRDVSEIVPSSAGYSYEAPVDAEEIKSAYIPPAEVKEAIAEPIVDDEIVKEYLPPVAEIKEASETAELADDGYRYKTVRKLKYRQRRDVSEIVSSTPVETEKEESISEANLEYLPPVVAEIKEASDIPSETAELAEDGYRYKTIRKLKYRQRRDVSEIVAPESAILADDGYHYRIPESTQVIPKISNEYLPPSEELRQLPEEPMDITSTESPVVTESTPVVTESTTTVFTEAAPIVTETTAEVTTEAPSTTPVPVISKEYLPPLEEAPLVKEAIEVSSTTAAPPAVSNQYLPPVEEVAQIKEAPEIPEETAVLADDGYHYKVGKRFRFRRDVSEIIANENGYAYEAPAATNEATNIYLPPVEVKEAIQSTEASQVSSEYLPPASEESKNDAEIIEAPEESAILADDGYHYKTVRRLKYRSRRDVSEIAAPSDGYLYSAPAAAEEESVVLADDGYRYKTIRRLKYRHRRDVSELVSPSVEESAILAEDGYHYKTPSTVLPKVSNEYLPPAAEEVAEVKESLIIEPTIAPEVSNEYLPPSEATPKEAASPVVSNEYLPPTEDVHGNAELVEVPEPSAILADDGYHYKTVRRIRYRHRRDVSEIANKQAEGYTYSAPIEIEPQEMQYLPPQVEEVAQVKEASDDSVTLADDGYHYKTARRIRYRHRV